MTTQEQINVLESRQIALSNEMASSDAHASKCIKLDLNYGETYPEELERYKAAREEFNANERQLSVLYEQRQEAEQHREETPAEEGE